VSPLRQPSAQSPSIRAVVPSLVVDGLCPFLAYKLLTAYVPGMTQILALGLGALFPAARGVLEIWRRRTLDIIGAIVLVGIGVSIVALLAGGSPRMFLIRESFVTGALGLVAFSSFAWRRPLLFYIGRQFSAGDDVTAIEQFNQLWQYAGARRTFRLLTLAWAVGWLGEFALRVVMVLTLSPAQVLAISPFVFNGITIGLIAWTLAFVKKQRQRQQTKDPGRDLPAASQ
jgi:hypothetical protein